VQLDRECEIQHVFPNAISSYTSCFHVYDIQRHFMNTQSHSVLL
jgi:hypothetical protein